MGLTLDELRNVWETKFKRNHSEGNEILEGNVSLSFSEKKRKLSNWKEKGKVSPQEFEFSRAAGNDRRLEFPYWKNTDISLSQRADSRSSVFFFFFFFLSNGGTGECPFFIADEQRIAVFVQRWNFDDAIHGFDKSFERGTVPTTFQPRRTNFLPLCPPALGIGWLGTLLFRTCVSEPISRGNFESLHLRFQTKPLSLSLSPLLSLLFPRLTFHCRISARNTENFLFPVLSFLFLELEGRKLFHDEK